MPVSEKVRIEVYVPDTMKVHHHRLLHSLKQEFSYTFGGASIIRGIEGTFLSNSGVLLSDRIALLYTDAPLSLIEDRKAIVEFTTALHDVAFDELQEEAVLVAIHSVFHVDWQSR